MALYTDMLSGILPQYKLTAEQQTRILIDAITQQIKRKPSWTLEELRKQAPRIQGRSLSHQELVDEVAVAGITGELTLFEGVNSFFADIRVRERYGYYELETHLAVLIPADVRTRQPRFSEKNFAQRIKEAREVFFEELGISRGREKGASITDFFWHKARPLESKAKIVGRTYYQEGKRGGTVIFSGRKGKGKIHADNAYLNQLTSRGHEFVIGFTMVSLAYREMTLKEIEDFKVELDQATDQIFRAASRLAGRTIRQAEIGGFKKYYIAFAADITGFLPMVVNKPDFQKEVSRRVAKAEQRIDQSLVPIVFDDFKNEVIRIMSRTNR